MSGFENAGPVIIAASLAVGAFGFFCRAPVHTATLT
jgi:hypothetical protein